MEPNPEAAREALAKLDAFVEKMRPKLTPEDEAAMDAAVASIKEKVRKANDLAAPPPAPYEAEARSYFGRGRSGD